MVTVPNGVLMMTAHWLAAANLTWFWSITSHKSRIILNLWEATRRNESLLVLWNEVLRRLKSATTNQLLDFGARHYVEHTEVAFAVRSE